MEELIHDLGSYWDQLLIFFNHQPWLFPLLSIVILFPLIARKFLLKILRSFFQLIKNQFYRPMKQYIRSTLNRLLAFLVRLRMRISSPFEYHYYQSLIHACYHPKTAKVKLSFSGRDLEQIFVPLRLSPTTVNNLPESTITNKNITNNQEIWHFLAKITEDPAYRRIGIINYGAGKTKLLQHLTLIYAQKKYFQYNTPPLIPVLLYLRDLYPLILKHKYSLPELIIISFENQSIFSKLNPSLNWFTEHLRKGHCLVMLDGLDEVAKSTQKQEISHWISEQIQRYPKNTFIVTSRPDGYQIAPVEQLETLLEVQPFNFEQIQNFVYQWYQQLKNVNSRGKGTRRKQVFLQNQAQDLIECIIHNQAIATMARNPLLLKMIATVHTYQEVLPKRKVELYAKICEVLLKHGQFLGKNRIQINAHQQQSILQILALELMKRNALEFSLEQVNDLLQDLLYQLDIRRLTPELFLEQIKLGSGLLFEKEPDIYQFTHLSFQEYLAATQIKQGNLINLLIDKFSQPFWSETIRFFAAQSDATPLIENALANPNDTSLSLAYDCLQQGLIVATPVKLQLENLLNQELENTDSVLFKLAAEVCLSQRLNHLLQIDPNVSIDTNYINCAEYQLFVDQRRQIGENRQPDHWTISRFAPGEGKKPITGMRATDAEEFCQWLTQWRSEVGFHYRLPTLAEASKYLVIEKQIGCWCTCGEEKAIAGIENNQWLSWHKNITDILESDPASKLVRIQATKLDLTLILGHALDLDLALDLARDLAFDLGHDPLLNRNLDSVITHAYARALVDRDLTLGYIQDLARTLESALDLSGELELDLAQIGSYLLLVSGFWYRLSRIYQDIIKDPKQLQAKKITYKACHSMVLEFKKKGDEAFNIYAFFVLIEERRAGRIPAWEGIRIVREKI